jgi:hypothetical protein
MSVLEKHRDVIMKYLKHFDEVLKYVNELSGTIELEDTMIRAEGLFRRFERTVEAVDRQGRFPLPNARMKERGDARRLGGLRDVKTVEERAERSGKSPHRGFASGTSSSDGQTTAPATGHISAETEKVNVISPELRLLLSRRVIGLGELDTGVDSGESHKKKASGLRN